MARIPEEQIAALKQGVSLKRLAEARGVALRKEGADWVGLCCFHEEDSPSMHITEEKGLFHCFGCDAGGDAFAWVQKVEGISFRQAFELLRAGYPDAVAPTQAPPAKKSTALKLPPLAEDGVTDRELMLHVVRFYRDNLLTSSAALEYLRRRGIGSQEAIERFCIGFSDRTLGYRIPAATRAAGASLRSRLQSLGVYAPTGHERFRGCITVPLYDETGAVVQLYGRRISSKIAQNERHLVLPAPIRGVFNREAFAASREMILCEGITDALAFYCAGLRNVTACLGAGNLTEELVECFAAHGIERVFIAFDPDGAGNQGAEEAARRLGEKGVECLRVEFPAALDANEFALRYPPAAKSLGQLLSLAPRMGGGRARSTESEPAPAALVLPEASSAQPAAKEPEALEPAAAQQLAAPAAREGNRAADAAQSRTTPSLAARAAEPAAAAAGAAALAGLKLDGEQVELALGDRRYRVLGLAKNTSLEQLRVNVRVERGEDWHQDNVDLYSAQRRRLFIKQAAVEVGLPEDAIKRDVGKLLRALEELHEQRVRESLAPKRPEVRLSEAEREEALTLLRDPHLVERIAQDFERCGLVGERTGKLVGYFGCVSRLLERPLGVLLQSSSAAGKSSLMDAVLAFMPPEQIQKYSALTGQALYYLGEGDLAHKILAIAEEGGSQRAAYSLKLLLSEGKLSIAAPGKDPETGKLVTHEYRSDGPTMVLTSTTAAELDEELQNRCMVLGVDESREQTRAIHEQQRRSRSLEGLWAREDRARLVKQHQNAQRLLEPLEVVNPYERHLTFLDDRTRTRRDHLKYLTLIDAIALCHQHQRPVRRSVRYGQEKLYIEVELSDIELATALCHEVLGRSLDELSPQTRRFLGLLDQMTSAACQSHGIERPEYRFSQREAREHTGWSDFAVKTHLRKLVELEYVLVHRGGRGQSFLYELLYRGEGADGKPFVLGLIDTHKLRRQLSGQSYDADREHPQEDRVHEKADRELSGSYQGATGEHGGSIEPRADGKGASGQNGARRGKTRDKGTEPIVTAAAAIAPRNGSGRAEEGYTP